MIDAASQFEIKEIVDMLEKEKGFGMKSCPIDPDELQLKDNLNKAWTQPWIKLVFNMERGESIEFSEDVVELETTIVTIGLL